MEDFEDIFGIIKRLLIVTEVSKQTIQDCIVITILNKKCAPHLYMYLTPIEKKIYRKLFELFLYVIYQYG